VRLAFLVSALGVTALWAAHDISSRKARTEWERPLSVAIVVVQSNPVDAAALRALTERTSALETRLASEFRRYGGRLEHPVSFTPFGPVHGADAPPDDPAPGVLALARHSYDLWRWTSRIDSALGLPSRGFDSRIYLIVSAPKDQRRKWVEGSSEQGGRVGVAKAELDESTIDLALFVVTHEFFHTLGASDKYDASGRALVPSGLVEPNRVPLYPQRYAEVMARNVPLSETDERPPDSLAELGVGLETAREIGWAH
jgi:hypothetical protein